MYENYWASFANFIGIFVKIRLLCTSATFQAAELIRPQVFYMQGYFWVMRPRNRPPGSSARKRDSFARCFVHFGSKLNIMTIIFFKCQTAPKNKYLWYRYLICILKSAGCLFGGFFFFYVFEDIFFKEIFEEPKIISFTWRIIISDSLIGFY